MRFRTGMMAAGIWMTVCSWVTAAPVERTWSVPFAQQVRVPSGIQNGIFYPEHDELVFIKPGMWGEVMTDLERMPATGNKAMEKDPLALVLTLHGRLKLTAALKAAAQAAGMELVIGSGVEDGDIVADMDAVSVRNALMRLLSVQGYGFRVNGKDLIVSARDTRVFRVNLPPVFQGFDAVTSNESASTSSSGTADPGRAAQRRVRVGAKVTVENSSGVLSYWQDIEANVRSLVSPAGVVALNKAAGVVVVTDAPRELDRIEAFLDDMNERAAQQIMVDVKVVEVELSNEHQLGIDWSVLSSRGDMRALHWATNFASENMPSGNMMTFSARVNKDGSGDTESGVKAVVKALEEFGRIEVVSQPRIMMLNNSLASIQVGETRSYVESTNMETTQGGATIASAVLNEVHGGVTLQIVGSIVGDDVFLNVTPVVSTIDDIRTITLGGGNKLEAPETSMKTMSTLVRVKIGRTAAIGGLITRDRSLRRSGVPFLSRIPVLGKIFSYEARRNRRTELVIFMTPHRG